MKKLLGIVVLGLLWCNIGFADHRSFNCSVVIGTPPWENPDFVKYAESYGATGHRVDSAESLVPIFEKAFEAGGVHLVDLPVDYSENQRVLIDELAEKVCLI